MKNLLKKSERKCVLLLIAAALIILSCLLPLPKGLSRAAMQSFGIILAAIVLWVGEFMNMAATGIFMAVLLVFMNILSPEDMFKGFGGSVFFFMVGTMSITVAVESTSIPARIAGTIMLWAKKSPVKLVVGFALGTAVLSSIMSNIAVCALFATLGVAVLKANGNPRPGKSNLGKSLMMAIPAGSVLGGFMTPVGSPTNIIAVNYLANPEVGHPVTFLQWMAMGCPIAIILTILVSLFIVYVFKPEVITDEAIEKARLMVNGNGPLNTKEKKTLVIIGIMFVSWIASSWVPVLNTTCVALMGTCLFMFPGIGVMTWKEYSQKAGWDATFIMGSVGTLADAAVTTGGTAWIISSVLGGAGNWSPSTVFLLISFLICIIHIFVPSGPAVAGLAVVPIATLANSAGINPAAAALLVSFWSAAVFALPTDAVPMQTYKYGYYSFRDMMKAGIPISFVLAIVVAFLIPEVIMLMGL